MADNLADFARLQRELAESKARVAALEASAAKQSQLRCKVSEKGALSVYGLNSKWPVTLYPSQWARVAEFMPTITAFAAANTATLKQARTTEPAAAHQDSDR